MSRIWIVRHGNTFGPDEGPRRIGARTDLPLVESGQAQAHALADWFAREGIVFDRVLSSPLRRTRETAAILAPDTTPEIVDWLAEIDHGPDEDQPEAAVIARIGADAIAAWDHEGIAPAGWAIDSETRLAGWRAFLAVATDSRDVLLVTSNGAARFALAADADLARDAAALGNRKLRTGAFAMLVSAPDGAWRIEVWNRRP